MILETPGSDFPQEWGAEIDVLGRLGLQVRSSEPSSDGGIVEQLVKEIRLAIKDKAKTNRRVVWMGSLILLNIVEIDNVLPSFFCPDIITLSNIAFT